MKLRGYYVICRMFQFRHRLWIYALLIFLLVWTSAGCSNKLPAYTRRRFGNCYSGDSTGLAARLELGGFYRYYELSRRNSGRTNTPGPFDSIEHSILLYENGNFALGLSLLGASTGERIAPSQTSNLAVDTTWLHSGIWGIYRLSGDTIIGQWLYPSRGTISSFGGFECRYLILGRSRLQYLDAASGHLDRMTGTEKEAFRQLQSQRTYSEADFIPLDMIPPVRSWLNQEPWLRCK